MSVGKKKMCQIASKASSYFLMGVSKAWLADLVVDLVRRSAGDENLDGVDLVEAVIAEATAITAARGDERSVTSARKSAIRGAQADAAVGDDVVGDR